MRFIAKDLEEEKVIPQMALTSSSLLCFCTRKKSNLSFFSVLDISNFEFCTSKRRKVEIGSFRACIFDGNIENAICIKSRAPCEHRRRRGRVVCVHATAAACARIW